MALAVLLMLMGACEAQLPITTVPPSPSPSLGAAIDWGPLAVANTVGPDGRKSGTLRIDDKCAVLDSGVESGTLIWPVNATQWDPIGQRILFRRADGEVVALGSGEQFHPRRRLQSDAARMDRAARSILSNFPMGRIGRRGVELGPQGIAERREASAPTNPSDTKCW
jgi:hypothetical protein